MRKEDDIKDAWKADLMKKDTQKKKFGEQWHMWEYGVIIVDVGEAASHNQEFAQREQVVEEADLQAAKKGRRRKPYESLDVSHGFWAKEMGLTELPDDAGLPDELVKNFADEDKETATLAATGYFDFGINELDIDVNDHQQMLEELEELAAE